MSAILQDPRNLGPKPPFPQTSRAQQGAAVKLTDDFGGRKVRVSEDGSHAPFRTTACACASLRRASRAISHLYDQVLAPSQLKATQYIILCAIDERGETAHCDLARELTASVETLSRRLAAARKAGLVQVHKGEQNRRVYCLTARGKLALERATRYWQNAQRRLQDSLEKSDWDMLTAFTERLVAAASRAESMALANGDGVHAARPAPMRIDTMRHKLL